MSCRSSDPLAILDHAQLRNFPEGPGQSAFAIDALPDGSLRFVGRLVLCNGRYKGFYPAVAHLLQPGASRRLVADEAVAAGQFRANGRQSGRGGATPQRDGGGDNVREEWLSDGRCLLASEGPSPDDGTIGLRTDTTDRIRTERIVRQSRVTSNVMMDAVDEMIAMVNSEGVVLAINRAGAQWLSAQPDQVIGQSLATVLGGALARTVAEMMDTVLDAGNRHRKEVAWHDRILDVSVHPVMTEDGAPLAVTSVVRDISERRAADERARNHQQVLARCVRVATMGEMAAAIAHEISQPITAIITACYACLAELASARAVGADAIDAIEDARREAERANELVQAVLDLARSTLAGRRIVFELDFGRQLPLVIVNAIEIEQVILNLLRNSIDALGNGDAEQPPISGEPRVTICTRQIRADAIEVSVRDNGAGLPAETMSRAFTPFYSTKADGMGMGLAICRTIIDSDGGGIWAKVAPEGARVAFTLPLKEPCRAPR